MPEIKRSALMPYPARFMYDIVNDVDSYPEFLPWCGEVETHQLDDISKEASILASTHLLKVLKRDMTHTSTMSL